MDVTLHAAGGSADWLAHVATIIKALAWPGAFIIVAAMFRVELRARIGAMQELTAGPLRAVFAAGVAEVRTDLAAATVAPPAEAAAEAAAAAEEELVAAVRRHPEPEPVQKQRTPLAHARLKAWEALGSYQSPRQVSFGLERLSLQSIVINEWSQVEGALQSLARTEGQTLTNPTGLIMFLESVGIIEPSHAAALHKLYELRNIAVHSPESLTLPDAQGYSEEARLARQLLEGVRKARSAQPD